MSLEFLMAMMNSTLIPHKTHVYCFIPVILNILKQQLRESCHIVRYCAYPGPCEGTNSAVSRASLEKSIDRSQGERSGKFHLKHNLFFYVSWSGLFSPQCLLFQWPNARYASNIMRWISRTILEIQFWFFTASPGQIRAKKNLAMNQKIAPLYHIIQEGQEEI